MKFFGCDVTRAVKKYLENITDTFFHCADVLGVDLQTRGIYRKNNKIKISVDSDSESF